MRDEFVRSASRAVKIEEGKLAEAVVIPLLSKEGRREAPGWSVPRCEATL